MGEFFTGLGVTGLGVTGLGVTAGTSLFSHPLGASQVAKAGKSVVVVYLNGGVSQFESWDPKSDLQTGGQIHRHERAGYPRLGTDSAYGQADASHGIDTEHQHRS